MAYFDSQDTDRESELTAREAAELQLGGHPITDEDGNLVTVLAEETLNDNDEDELDGTELKDEHVKSVQDLNGDEPEVDEDNADGDESKSEGEEPLSDEEKEKQAQLADPQTSVAERDHSQDGPAHANNPSGYAPTGL